MTHTADLDALIADVLKNPRDALALSVLADWLEDQGRAGDAAAVRSLAGKAPQRADYYLDARPATTWFWRGSAESGKHHLPPAVAARLEGRVRSDPAWGAYIREADAWADLARAAAALARA